jgi:hypothetical protein
MRALDDFLTADLARTPHAPSRRPWAAARLVFGVGPVLALLAVTGCASRAAGTHPTTGPRAPDPAVRAAPGANDLAGPASGWGIEVLGVRRSAAGYMLDFRYRVVDPEKALPLMNRSANACLVDQATGLTSYVPAPPKVGALRQTSAVPHASRTYFVIFANPGRRIAAGNKVTVKIGECVLEDLVVQ